MNILGLAIGMASAVFILLYLLFESGFEDFHANKDRIYRVTVEGLNNGQSFNHALTAAPLARTLVSEYHDIEKSVRVGKYGAWLVSCEDIRFNEDRLLFADSGYFDIFTHRFLLGDPETALQGPNKVVLTEETARKYFGNIDPLGKYLKIEDDSTYYKVTGIIQNIPDNTHLHFDMLASLSSLKKYLHDVWSSHMYYTYILVNSNIDISKLENDLAAVVDQYVKPELSRYMDFKTSGSSAGNNYYSFELQPVSDIHLKSNLQYELEPNSDIRYLYIFLVLAILSVIIACINFMSLSTARAASRAKEIGIRKLAGSGKKLLIRQFLVEYFIMSFIALGITLLLAELLLPLLNNYLSLNLNLQLLKSGSGLILIIALTGFVGLAAGSYPAFFLSSFKTVDVLKGWIMPGRKNVKLRVILVFFQFLVATVSIILTFIIYAQWRFIQDKDLGFRKDHMLVIRRPDALHENLDNFKKDIKSHPDVLATTNSNTIPGRIFTSTSYKLENSPGNKSYLINQLFVNYDFKETFDIGIINGRFFSKDHPADSFACILNEAAVQMIGEDSVIGRKLLYHNAKSEKNSVFTIIGVARNFHFETLETKMQPLVIQLMHGNWEGYLTVSLRSEKVGEAVSFIESTWNSYTRDYPFVHFHLDDDLQSHYDYLLSVSRIFIFFSILSVFVACLGLLGLLAFTSSRRLHEIGIRKAMGASVTRIIFLLSKETGLLVLGSTIFAWIIVYIVARWWLADFSYRVIIHPLYFIIATLIVLIVSLITTGLQSYKSAVKDPGESLRDE